MLHEIAAAIAKVTREPVDLSQLKNSKALVADLGLNSITRMRLIMQLERSLQIEIDLEQIDITVFNSLEQLEQYIQHHSKAIPGSN